METATRLPLFDEDSETVILALLLTKKSVCDNILQIVQEDDFYDLFRKAIFQKMRKILQSGRVCDFLVLKNEFQGIHPTQLEYIAGLQNTIGTASNWKYYCERIKLFRQYRELIFGFEEARQITKITDVKSKLEELHTRLLRAADISGGSSIKVLGELLQPVHDEIQTRMRAGGLMSGLPTGFENINKITDGYQDEYLIIAARPSVGKTAFAVNSGMRIAQNHKIPVGFLSLEMRCKKIVTRIIADQTTINSRALRNGTLSHNAFQQVTDACFELGDIPFYIDDSSNNINALVSSARIMAREKKCKLLFIDHAMHIEDDTPGEAHEKVRHISKTIKRLQGELGIPIVLLQQISRTAEGKQPTLAELRGSGSLEEDADAVWFLYRERVSDEKDQGIPTKMFHAKSRDGEIGESNLLFYPAYTRFVDDNRSIQ